MPSFWLTRIDLIVMWQPGALPYPFSNEMDTIGESHQMIRLPSGNLNACDNRERISLSSPGQPCGGLITTLSFTSTCALSSAVYGRAIASLPSTLGSLQKAKRARICDSLLLLSGFIISFPS